MADSQKFTCPCCGYREFDEPPGSSDICGVCGWEDDYVQLRHPYSEVGANHESLFEAQTRFRGRVAAAGSGSASPARDPQWRPLDPPAGEPEVRGSAGRSSPAELLTHFLAFAEQPSLDDLYYWRRHSDIGGPGGERGGS